MLLGFGTPVPMRSPSSTPSFDTGDCYRSGGELSGCCFGLEQLENVCSAPGTGARARKAKVTVLPQARGLLLIPRAATQQQRTAGKPGTSSGAGVVRRE